MEITFEGSFGVSYSVLEAKLRAQYSESQSRSLTLLAGPGTNMEYTVAWTDQLISGQVSIGGESGLFNIRMPTVALMSSSDLGCIPGRYRLMRWDEAAGPITLYMETLGGELTLEENGEASWTISLRQRGDQPNPTPRISCRGRYYNSSLQLEGVPGNGNTAYDWNRNMESIRQDIWLAFAGWTVGGARDSYQLYPRELSGGNRILEMKNSKGTLIWEKIR